MKHIGAILLAACLLIGLGAAAAVPASAVQAGDFILPVVQQITAPAGYTAIHTAQELSSIRSNLTGNYILMNDIDLSAWEN